MITPLPQPAPALEPAQADVIIIGGGIVGTAVACWLSQAGRDVVLFERRGLASGASGRNGGMVMQVDGRDSDADAILTRRKTLKAKTIVKSHLAIPTVRFLMPHILFYSDQVSVIRDQ